MLRIARYLVGHAVDRLEVHLLRALTALSWRRRRALARRDRERPRETGRWFTPGELATVSSLSSLIVPSDENGPGATEADVPALLDRLVAASGPRQRLYARGLLACDEWARHEHGRLFAELPCDDQLALLKWIDRLRADRVRARSLTGKVATKAISLYHTWRCPLVELFPELLRDVQGAFYTSRISWEWLRYDGPPMPEGYPDLRERESR
jgi:gluconate 2-dehydrogenase subunit 3-like protein